MLEISDELDSRPDRPKQSQTVAAEDVLKRELDKRGDPKLQDIVKTIQEHQDQVIRTPSDGTLIINGVAGSGKTSIAYHRIAYLLYPDTHSNIQASRTIVFGPNRLFMSFVKDLLPTLRVQDVNQATFDDWALERMGLAERKNGRLARKIEICDASLTAFLDPKQPREVRANNWRRARIKGREKMQALLENFVRFRRDRVRIPGGVSYYNLGQIRLSLALSSQEVQLTYQRVNESTADKPFENFRNQFLTALIQLLVSKYEFHC